MLSVIFISWSILKPSPWLSVLFPCCCSWGESVCSHWPFTTVGSPPAAGSGTVVESGGDGSVIFSAVVPVRLSENVTPGREKLPFQRAETQIHSEEGGRFFAELRLQLRKLHTVSGTTSEIGKWGLQNKLRSQKRYFYWHNFQNCNSLLT